MDFKELHQATLPKLAQLLRDIYPAGKLVGREYKVGNIRGKAGDSLSINIDTGVWGDFATGEKGGDFTSLLAARLGYTQTDAALLVQTMLDDPNAGKTELRFILSGGIKKSRVKPEALTGPDPTWVTDNFLMSEWGTPAGVWEYRNSAGRLVFVVCRYGEGDQKTYRPWTWDGARWICQAYKDGRPLYNQKGLADLPNARVLIVEGEKCVEAAKKALGEWFVPISWAGGAKAIDKTVWAPLAGRHVVIWPDADPPGYKAALDIVDLIKSSALSINIVNVQELPPGADVADMEMDGASLMAWIDANLVEQKLPEKSEKLPAGTEWRKDLQLTDRGAVRGTTHNIGLIIKHDPYFDGRWWIEEWDGRFYIKDQVAGETEIFNARVHFSRVWGIEVADDAIYKALEATLDSNNSIRNWVQSLVWDGIPRFNILAESVFKIPNNTYVSEVLRLLLCGMVARAVEPGCKFDYCIILRGPQGIGKTLFFEKLGRERYVMLYSRTTQDKDILGAVATGWVVSIEELFDTRASLRELKSMISSTVDTWRKPYHREMSSQPKRCVLVGTTDAEADFLDDMAGYRRFLIIECGKEQFDLELFDELREQLFAEAYHRWKSTPDWYRLTTESVEASNTITANWEVEDPWKEPISVFLEDKDTTTMLDTLTNCLFIGPHLHDSRVTKRVHRILVGLGFERVKLRAKGGNSGRLRAYQRRELLNVDPPTDESPN
jgi:putative DNA primase/helicase